MATLLELQRWLEVCRDQYDEGSQLFAELLKNEITRRTKSGRRKSPVPLKERNRLSARKSREKKKLDAAMKRDRKNQRSDAKLTSHRISVENGTYQSR